MNLIAFVAIASMDYWVIRLFLEFIFENVIVKL